MHEHTYFFKVSSDSGASKNVSVAISGEGHIEVDVTVGASATNQRVIGIPIDVSQVKSFALLARQDCVVYTNDVSGGSPANVFTLKANVAYFFSRAATPTWKDTAGTTVSTDITDFYVTCAYDATHELNIDAVLDATP
jgi:hypothetical protein